MTASADCLGLELPTVSSIVASWHVETVTPRQLEDSITSTRHSLPAGRLKIVDMDVDNSKIVLSIG
jgi:hypothetical protein